MTFRNKLITGVVLVMALLTSLLVWDLTNRQRKMLLDYELEHTFALARALATASADWLLASNVAGLQELVEMEKTYPELCFAMLTRVDGQVLAHTETARVGMRVTDMPATAAPEVLANSRMFDVAVPVELNERQLGWARIGISMDKTEQQLGNIIKEGIVYCVLAISMGGVVAWSLSRYLTRGLYTVQNTIDRVKSGRRNDRIALEGRDEVAVLAREFNQMLDILSQRESELEEVNALLGQTVANRTQQLEDSLALVKNRELELKTAQHVAKIGSWALDFSVGSLTLSDEAYNILGLTKDVALDWDMFLAHVHDEDRDAVVDAWVQALQGGSLEIEHRIMDDGLVRWVRELVEIRYSDAGELLQAIGTIQDITSLKESILALRKSEQQMRAIIDASPVPSTLQDGEHRIIYVNEAFTRNFGYTREEVASLRDRLEIFAVAYPDRQVCVELRFKWNDRLEQSRQGAEFEPMELRIYCKDGSVRTVLAQASCLEEQTGPLYLVTLTDVTELNSLFSRMKSLLETASDAIHILDENGHIYEFSDSFAKMLGYTREEAGTLTIADWDPSVARGEENMFLSSLPAQPTAYETSFLRKDGTAVDVEINAKKIELEGRRYLYGAARDISGRKVAEAKIRQLADIVETSGDAILSETLEGIVNSWNRGAEQLFGYTTEEMLGRNVEVLLPKEKIDEEKEILQTISRGRTVSNIETLRVDKRGRVLNVSITVAPLFDEHGEVAGASKIIRDITRLKESEERFRNLFLESPDAFLLMELTGSPVISDCNSAAERILAGTREQIVGLQIAQISPPVLPDGRPTQEAIDERLAMIGRQGSQRFEWLHRRLNGEDFWADVSVAAINMEGRPVQLVSLRDISKQKRTALQLEATLNLLELATSAAEMGIWAWDVKTDMQIWDDRMFDLYEVPKEMRSVQVAYDFSRQFMPPDDFEELNKQAKHCAQVGGEFKAQFRIRLPGGRIRYIDAAARPERNNHGEIVRLVGTNRDVTRAKENEQKLADSEAQFRHLFEENHSVMMIIDPQTQTVFAANQAAVQFYGYSEEDLVGMSLQRLNPITQDKLDQRIEQMVEKGQRYFTFKHRLASGDLRDVELYITPLQFGGIVRLFGIYHDVTDRVQVQAALEDANRKILERGALLQHVLDTVSVAVVLIDRAGVITLANRRAAEMFRCSIESIIGQDYSSFVHQEEREISRQSLVEMLLQEGASVVEVERRFLRSDGEIFWGRLLGQKFSLTGKEITGVVGSVADISKRKVAEEQLIKARDEAEAANKSKSEFLANMSHEIRTPLNGVIGLTNLLKQTPLTQKQQDYLLKIDSSSKALLAILNDILDYSKIEANFLELEEDSFYLDDLLSGISDLFSVLAEEKGLEFLFAVDPNVPPHLQGDIMRLRQVLSNLVGNAIKFTERGEILVSIKLVEQGENVVRLNFSVRDSGMGISVEDQQRLFHAFQQADGSTTRRFGGTGLGLSISKKIVELMGGEIGVLSLPGEGSTFSFTVPMRIKQDQPLLRDPANLRGMRVLVVDDQLSSLEVLQQLLEAWGFVVTAVPSGDEAMREVARGVRTGIPFELLLLDWRMPGMDGFEVAQQVRKMAKEEGWTNPPMVIMATAFGREQVRKFSASAYFDAILDKPVTSSMLFDVIINVQYGKHVGEGGGGRLESGLGLKQLEAIAGASILLVEDNKVNQQVASELLTSFGLKVKTASDGIEALQHIAEEDFDAVLLDLQMPRMDGFETTRRVRALDSARTLPIIAMTAAALLQDKEACLAVGMNDHIAKPIDPEVLSKTLLKWISPRARGVVPAADAALQEPKDHGEPFTLPGFDLTESARRMGGDYRSLRKTLHIFHAEFTNTLNDLKAQIETQQYGEAARTVHTLKGASGNVGAIALYQVAVSLEQELKAENRSGLPQFERIFAETMSSLSTLDGDDNAQGCYNCEKAIARTAVLSELGAVLAQQRIVPETILAELDAMHLTIPDRHLIPRLKRQIDAFDYQAALITLAALEKARSVASES